MAFGIEIVGSTIIGRDGVGSIVESKVRAGTPSDIDEKDTAGKDNVGSGIESVGIKTVGMTIVGEDKLGKVIEVKSEATADKEGTRVGIPKLLSIGPKVGRFVAVGRERSPRVKLGSCGKDVVGIGIPLSVA